MITRYFRPSPTQIAPLQFLAGFGQQRHVVEAAEAGIAQEQGRLLSQGIAQGGQALARGISQGALARFQAGQQTQQQKARAALLKALQQQRTQDDIYKAAVAAYVQAGGIPGQPPPGLVETQTAQAAQMAPPAPPAAAQAVAQPIGADAALMGPPAPGEPQPIPLTIPQIAPQAPDGVPAPLIDPSTTGKYRKVQEEVDLWKAYQVTVATNPNIPADQKARELATLARAIAPKQAFLNKNRPTPPPRTFPEMVQVGVNQGGFTPLPDGGLAYPKDFRIYKPTKRTENPYDKLSPEGKKQYINDRIIVGDLERFAEEGGIIAVDNEGNLDFNRPRGGADGFDWMKFIEKRLDRMPVQAAIEEARAVESALELHQLQRQVDRMNEVEDMLELVEQRGGISRESHDRMLQINDLAEQRPLTRSELSERAALAVAWRDALISFLKTGVTVPAKFRQELLLYKDLLHRYAQGEPPPPLPLSVQP